ncbi:NAD(P)/FAD-dependent oxidoreductase (plasmid) [Nocardia sp. CA-084685]|uniref:NAD(P)/FAD-dependent oxidoreductase n=1 Tax=Nocardia sp. CA-084685 TaxID=3239970 RepID=UPI003D96E1D7
MTETTHKVLNRITRPAPTSDLSRGTAGADPASTITSPVRRNAVSSAAPTRAAGRGTAVVIGGGLAGLLAAHVLSEFCNTVVVERDRYPDQPVPRAGVPQAHHAHLFLEGGLRALEALLRGIRAELTAAGAVEVVMGADLRWLNAFGYMATHDRPTRFMSCTRGLLDHVVRSRVIDEDLVRSGGFAKPSIQIMQGVDVVGLLGDSSAVNGVRIRNRDDGTVEDLPAQMVVDASGRKSKLTEWLKQLGCPPVAEQRVDAGCAYISRLYHRPPVDLGFRALYLQAAPGQPRTGSILPVEGERWIVSLGGMRNAQPGRGDEGFDEMLEQMRDPILRDTLRRAEPASAARWFAAGPSVRRKYRGGPDGLVRVGDAADVVNPVYGQGMTNAVRGAQALGVTVARHHGIDHAAARAARKAIAAVTRDAWLMSIGEDARFPATLGAPSGAMTHMQHWYLDRVLDKATQDPHVAAAFTSVMSLTASPTALFRPTILAPALLGIG